MRHLKFIGVVFIGAALAGCGSQSAENAGLANMPLKISDAEFWRRMA